MRLLWKILIVVAILILVVTIMCLVGFRRVIFGGYIQQPFKNIWEDTNEYGEKNLDIMLGIFRKINTIFEKNDIPYFFLFGNLIGIMRHGDLIPWDDDMDICVSESNFKKLLSINHEFNKVGLNVEKYPNMGIPTKQILRIHRINEKRILPIWNFTWPFVDIFAYKDRGDKIEIVIPAMKNDLVTKKDIFPLQPYDLHGVQVYIPSNPRRLLDERYKNWDKEAMSTDLIHRNFTRIKNRKKVPMSQLQHIDEDVFNSVWIISTNKDKRKEVERKLNDVDIYPNVWTGVSNDSKAFLELYSEINNPKVSKDELASLLSHYSLWKHLEENEYQHAIILENDIDFSPNFSKDLLMTEMNDSIGFVILFLGHNKDKLIKKPTTYLGHANGRHAYALSKAGISQLCNLGNNVINNLNDMTNDICKTELCFLSHTDSERGNKKGGGIVFKHVNAN